MFIFEQRKELKVKGGILWGSSIVYYTEVLSRNMEIRM